jgi:hypothetical protein
MSVHLGCVSYFCMLNHWNFKAVGRHIRHIQRTQHIIYIFYIEARCAVCSVQYGVDDDTSHLKLFSFCIMSIAQCLKIPKLNTTLRKPGPFTLLV